MTALAILFLLVGALLLLKNAARGTPIDSRPPKGARVAPRSGRFQAHWVPRDNAVEVAGMVLPGGMLYVGRGLTSVASSYDAEPALIDPSLRVARQPASMTDAGMPYWPSYSEITPSARRAYLTWLAGGRCEPSVDIGLVFLFFYGLERRALTDSRSDDEARRELPDIAVEVDRLLSIYQGSGSFCGYASNFLVAVRLLQGEIDVDIPVESRNYYELPFGLKLRLGRCALERKPLPAALALEWAERHPEIYFRTPSERCREEFQRLFAARYYEKYDEGMVLRQCKKPLSFEYRPASASYAAPIRVDFGDVPDVSTLKEPVEKLKQLSADVEAELDPYSRYLGRRPDARESLAALALLPSTLLADHSSRALAELRTWTEAQLAAREEAIVPATELLAHWTCEELQSPKKRELSAYAQLLGKLSIGFEPDPRFGSVRLRAEDRVVLFRLSSQSAAPSERYIALTTVLQLAAAVTVADGSVSEAEERHLEQHLTKAMDLESGERERLSAHLTWLLASRTRLVASKKRVATLSPADKAKAAALLVALTSADGRIDREEVRLLEKVYALLGLPAERLYSDLHGGDVEESPVVVESPGPRTELRVPADASTAGAALDMSRVERTLAETRTLQVMLGQIFSDDDQSAQQAVDTPIESPIEGLDAAHAELLKSLLRRAEWSQAEFDDLCTAQGLLAGGASEVINEFAFDKIDAPLLEGEDPVVVNHEIAQELMQ